MVIKIYQTAQCHILEYIYLVEIDLDKYRLEIKRRETLDHFVENSPERFRTAVRKFTCEKLTISYSGVTEASNGYHVVKIIEWLVSMRNADWVAW
jgi:hypothetical protein